MLLSYIALLLASFACVGACVVAFRERARISRDVTHLVEGVEVFTGEDESARRTVQLEDDLKELLSDVVDHEEHAIAVLAINELTGRASLHRTRSMALARGLSRICLLSGACGAFLLAAAGGFSERALVLAGCAVGVGVVTSIVANSLSAGARRFSRKYGELVDVLARQVESRFRERGPEVAASGGRGSSTD